VGGKVVRRWDLAPLSPNSLGPWCLETLNYGLSFVRLFDIAKNFQNLSFSLDLMLINILPNINLTTMSHRLPHYRHNVTFMSPPTHIAYMNAPN
jgi:hypothetical protein